MGVIVANGSPTFTAEGVLYVSFTGADAKELQSAIQGEITAIEIRPHGKFLLDDQEHANKAAAKLRELADAIETMPDLQ